MKKSLLILLLFALAGCEEQDDFFANLPSPIAEIETFEKWGDGYWECVQEAQVNCSFVDNVLEEGFANHEKVPSVCIGCKLEVEPLQEYLLSKDWYVVALNESNDVHFTLMNQTNKCDLKCVKQQFVRTTENWMRVTLMNGSTFNRTEKDIVNTKIRC